MLLSENLSSSLDSDMMKMIRETAWERVSDEEVVDVASKAREYAKCSIALDVSSKSRLNTLCYIIVFQVVIIVLMLAGASVKTAGVSLSLLSMSAALCCGFFNSSDARYAADVRTDLRSDLERLRREHPLV